VRLYLVILVAALFFISGCASMPSARASVQRDWSAQFGEFDGCLVIYDVNADTYTRHNAPRAAKRFSPCSTFKIPNSLIGLDSGVLDGPEHLFRWDGVVRDRTETNRDHILRTAYQISVVWCYQEIARRVGEARMAEYLKKFDYGNRDMSAGLTEFWLDTSLRISADEQVRFLNDLRQRKLPIREHAMSVMLDDVMIADRGDGWIYRGKTGSAKIEGSGLGWWVGMVERGDRAWVFAANMNGPEGYGPKVRRIVEGILREEQILPPAGSR